MKAERRHSADWRFESDGKQKYKKCNSTPTTIESVKIFWEYLVVCE